MAFNFGAFAGGLSQGIQAGQKLALEQEQLQNARDKATAELKKQEQDSLIRVATDVKAHNDKVSTLTQKMNSSTNQEDYNSYANELNSSIESFTKLYQAQIDNDLLPKQASNLYSQARLQGVEPVEIVKIKDYNNKDVEVPLPQSMASHPEDYALMENGKIGEAFMGTDKKIAGYNPTNYSPVKFKVEDEYGKGTIDVFDNNGGKTSVTNKQYFDAKASGTPYRNYIKPEKATIINTGDKNPTAYTTVGVSALPEVQQQVLLGKGYTLNDKITNTTLAKILEQDNKPESLTQQEAKVKNMMETPEFQDSFGKLSIAEQKIKAQDKIWNDELEKDPSKFKEFGEQVALDFQIKNDLSKTQDIAQNYDKLTPLQKKGLLKGQKESPEGKDYASNHAGSAKSILDMERRADVIMKMTPEVLSKGFIVNTWDDAVSSIPDKWINMSEAEKRTYLNKISTNGAVNDLFFVYLNAVNKGAPSNADMEVMKTIVQGLSSGNLETTQQAVKNFMSQVSNDTKSYYEDNAKSLYAVAKKEYDNVSKFKYTQPIKVYGVDDKDKKELPPLDINAFKIQK